MPPQFGQRDYILYILSARSNMTELVLIERGVSPQVWQPHQAEAASFETKLFGEEALTSRRKCY
jgi:hypothetical protein